jgi:ribonuclease BN (tRNA processing enzyme)
VRIGAVLTVSISIRFLGTGGARFVVAKQIRASGGMWIRFGSTQVHIDPGPGALVRALATVPPQKPAELDAIVLSHKHLDHAGDVNAMIEAMAQGGWKPRGALFAPRDAWEGDSILLPYARRFLPCTRFFEGLIEDYAAHAPDVLVINVLRYADSLDVDHLTFDEARRVIAGIRPRAAIMTHFGTKMLERDPRRLAYELEDELGLKVYAASDDWLFDDLV